MRGRHLVLALPLLLWGLALPPRAAAAVDVSVHIGVDVPAYPELQPVPGYPVYYAPGLPANYFFYDGLYWVYVNDSWYSSSWYNGPWYLAEPAFVPVYVLRVPVSYYRVPPPYFRSWAPAEPPRWGAYWGPQWEAQHRGWNQWDRRHVPPPAPLPVYQRQYIGDRYPPREQQQSIREQQYRFQPRDEKVRERLAAEARPQTQAQRPAPPAARAAERDRVPEAQRPPAQQAQQVQQERREARERAAQQEQREARERAAHQQQEARQQAQQMQERQARERDQAQARQQQEARQQQQQARQAQQRDQQAHEQQQRQQQGHEQQRQQQAREQQQRQQQGMQERQREQQQEQAERRAQRPPPGRERDRNNGG